MSEPVRVHLRVPGTAPMPELVRHVQSIEAGGFDGAGILDSQMISRDTFVRGLGWSAVWKAQVALAVLGSVFLFIARRKMRKMQVEV